MNARRCLSTWLVLVPLGALATQPQVIQRRLQAGEKITFIDVRSTDFFQKGHLPGAINVPAAILEEKRLPRLGVVVIYDEGLGGDAAAKALPALNRKPGITAEILDGGYAGWMAAKGETTTAFGASKEEFPMITYQKLKTASIDDTVIVDLRKPPANAGTTERSATPAPALTDLRSEFPGVPVTRAPFSVPGVRKSGVPGAGGGPLLVLVDSGDGAAEATARALKANGNPRVVILAGGEGVIARQGQPGLQRLGHTLEAPASTITNTNR
jgi:rhodanese-related sulfurtransferase